MSLNASASKAAWTLTGLLVSLTFAGGTALAKPARAKRKTARAPVTKAVPLAKRHIKPARKTRGAAAPNGPGAVQPKDPGEIAFTLSANTPAVPYRGRIVGHYPREWRTDVDALGPGGEIWLSQNRVPNGSYAVAQLSVEQGHEYEVTLCTTGGGERVRASVGGVTHTFKSGDRKCDMTLVLKPEASGKANIKIDFADEPAENGANAFALLAVEVLRR